MIQMQRKIAPYVFISPFFILFLTFQLFPIGYSVYMSVFKWTLTGPQEFRGIENYINILTRDPFFMGSLVTTFLLLVFGSLSQHFVAIPLAISLNSSKVRGRNLFKIVYFLPFITSTVVIAIVFSQLFDQNYGWLNYIITRWFGGEKIAWLERTVPIRASIAIMVNWRFIGWNTVIYLAGLQTINPELYESAEIDGAGSLRKHTSITLPLLLPIIFFAVSMSIIGGIQLFEEPFILMGGYHDGMGGPNNAGLTSAYYLMGTGFNFNRFGKASAIAWILFVIIISMTWLNKMLTDKMQK